MKQTANLVTAPIAPTLLLFALPTLGASMLQSANGSIDAAWVGRLLGENALAATTNGNLIMFLLTSFVFGFGMASTILIGQAVGRGRMGAAKEVLGTAIGTFLPVALAIAVLGWWLAPDMLALLNMRVCRCSAQAYLLAILPPILPRLIYVMCFMPCLGGSLCLTTSWPKLIVYLRLPMKLSQ